MFNYNFKAFVAIARPQIAIYGKTSIRSITTSFAVTYRDHGDPMKVLEGQTDTISPPGKGQILLKMVAAPINPADINTIQGVYPVKPKFPAVGGGEGIGEVSDVGEGVLSVKVGDRVIPRSPGWGTWREAGVVSAEEVLPVANDIPIVTAATLGVNPCTAYRMLKDFADLKPGDVVIQNGANSGVGQAVIQIAAKLQIKTVNIVRKRDNLEELKQFLNKLGATHVVTDEFVRTPEMKELMKSLPKAKVAFNCVGGKAAAELLKFLDKGSSLVTYGGMSKQPIMAPAGPLIFNDLRFCGFWMTRWTMENKDSLERRDMWDFLCGMARDGLLKAPLHRLVDIKQFPDAVEKAMQPFTGEKQILIMDKNVISTSS